MSISNKLKSKLVHKMLGKLYALGLGYVTVERDPLGRRYEVNKGGVIASADDHFWLQQVYKKTAISLVEEGWTITNQTPYRTQFKNGDIYLIMELNDPVTIQWKTIHHRSYT